MSGPRRGPPRQKRSKRSPSADERRHQAAGPRVCGDVVAWGPRGEGLVRSDDAALMTTQWAIPGERVRVTALGRGEHRGFARLEEVIEASPDRVTPRCDRLEVCGSCSWMHLSAAAQRAHKASHVAGLLEGVLPPGVQVQRDAQASPQAFGYRNRASFVVGGRASALVVGAYKARSHDILDVGSCPVTDPSLLIARDTCRVALNAAALPPFLEATGEGVLKHLVLQAAPDSGQVSVVIVAARRDLMGGGGIPWLPIARSVLGLTPGPGRIVAVALSINPGQGNAILGAPPELLAGQPTLSVQLPGGPEGARLELPPGAFCQVNLAAADGLSREVARLAGSGPQLVDLYCGVGALAAALAPGFERIHGVEVFPGAAAAAARNLALAGAQATFYEGDVAERLAEVPRAEGEVLVVNPPRKGLGPEVCAALSARRPHRIVYVSCGPQALARDLRLLSATHRVGSVRVFDLFPQTHHAETVVLLEAR